MIMADLEIDAIDEIGKIQPCNQLYGSFTQAIPVIKDNMKTSSKQISPPAVNQNTVNIDQVAYFL